MDLRSIGRTPVSKDFPAGKDVKYDPDFEALQSEVGRLVSVGSADWKKIVKLASEILEHKSKDLVSASYLAVALIHIDNIEGLLAGLEIYNDLLTNFWDNMFPSKERMRARVSAVEWWVEKTEAALNQTDMSAAEPEAMDNTRKLLGSIDEILISNFEDPPSLFGIIKKLNTMPENLQEKDHPPLPDLKTTPDTKEKKDPETGNDFSIEELNDFFSKYHKKIRKTAMLMRKKNTADSKVYCQNRVAAWSMINNLPPCEKNFTKIHSPESNLKNHITTLIDKENWDTLLDVSEQELGRFIFWLDLNFYSFWALEMLGHDFDDARKAVCNETAFFIYRFSGLENLLFSDGTPFACDKTKKWLKTIALKKDEKVKKRIIPASFSKKDIISEELARVRKFASENNQAEALDYIQTGIQNSFSLKDSFKWRIILSETLLEWKQYELAMPHMKEILKIIKNHSLEDWNPELAVRGLIIVWKGFNKFSNNNYKEKTDELMNRIAVIDPGQAFKLKNEDSK